MKRLMIILMSVGLLFTGCKTSEANYRSAYEKAKAKQESPVENGTNGLSKYDVPQKKLIDGVETRVRTEYVRAVALTNSSTVNSGAVMKYNVVVGQFRQIFNARQMANRLKENGYAGAGILSNSEAVYYVFSSGTNSEPEAAEALKKIDVDESLKLKSPFPYILCAAGR